MASLHKLAIDAEKNLEQLATGLAEAGAEPDVVSVVSELAERSRRIAATLGEGQEATGNDEAPLPSEEEEVPAEEAPVEEEVPAEEMPMEEAVPAEEPRTIDQATMALQEAMRQSGA